MRLQQAFEMGPSFVVLQNHVKELMAVDGNLVCDFATITSAIVSHFRFLVQRWYPLHQQQMTRPTI